MNEMIVTDSQKIYEIVCSRDVRVPEEGSFHVVDVVVKAALEKASKAPAGLVTGGKVYNVKLLAVVTELPEDIQDAVEDFKG